MAQLAVVPAQVSLVKVDEDFKPAVAAAPIQKGQNVGPEPATGRMAVGGLRGIAFTRAIAAKYPVSVMKKGILELGDALQAVPFGTAIFGAPDGSLHDNNAVVGSVRMGQVMEGWSDRVPRKLLRVEM